LTLIKNFDTIIRNAQTPATAEARKTVLTLVEEAITSVDPRGLIKNRINLKGQTLDVGGLRFDLTRFRRILVAGAGKASGAMAEALEEQLGDRIETGIVNVPKGTTRNFNTTRIKLREAGHPIPDEGGLAGAQEITKLLQGLDEKTLVIFLLSGGGSALLPLPQEGICLAEKKATTDILLRCGATIEEVNAVRKHISAVKGGRLAAAAYPATFLTLILSDIVGDPIASIASGPTVPDPTTYKGAVEILQRYGVWDEIPPSVKACLEEGVKGERPESPKPGDSRFQRVHNIVLGNNRVALNAAEGKATSMGLRPLVLGSFIEGEARHVGTVLAGLAREMQFEGTQLSKYTVIIIGGETTVTVTGKGRGGRNQELVLNACLRLRGMDGVALASVGTDGVDGLSDYAGAIVDGYTAKRAGDKNLNPLTYLANNDSANFFSALDDEILTGPTGTNVNDIMILVNIGSKKRNCEMSIQIQALDYSKTTEEIVDFIRANVENARAKGVVVGLSGGVDSSLTVTLCVRALGKERVLGVLLPTSFTPEDDVRDAGELAKQLGIRAEYVNIEGITQSFFKDLKVDLQNSAHRMPAANIRARTRMIILYYYSNLNNYLVAGTGDKSEALIGFFTKYGDGGVDILPIIHLYKTQVRALAEYLGVPHRIAYKPSSPQLYPGHKATDEIPIDYERLDPVLVGLFDRNLLPEEVSRLTGVPMSVVEEVLRRFNNSKHKRAFPPSIEHR